MSKSLPTFALAMLVLACEPVTSSVVELVPRDGSAIASDAAARARDASVADSDSERCVTLIDQTLPEVVAADAGAQQRAVIALAAGVVGCEDADAGVQLLQATVYTRRDGAALVEAGQRYSFRWNALTTMLKRVHLVGGEQSCSDQTVVDQPFEGFKLSPLGLASCYEFDAPIDARYLRSDYKDYPVSSWVTFGTAPPEFQLCQAACPPGTAHDFSQDDAGTSSDASAGTAPDAGF